VAEIKLDQFMAILNIGKLGNEIELEWCMLNVVKFVDAVQVFNIFKS
jgi:hypothetical protein